MHIGLVTYSNPAQAPYTQGLVDYLRAQGHKLHGFGFVALTEHEQPLDCDAFIAVSIGRVGTPLRSLIEKYRAKNIPTFVFENGYFGTEQYQGVSLLEKTGVHNNSGEFLRKQKRGADRLEEVDVTVKPSRITKGKDALILRQVAGDTQLDGIDIDEWYEALKAGLESDGYSVRYRPHPVVETPKQSLYKDLMSCDLAVAYNSTSLVECIRLGVPFMTDISSQYFPMSTTKASCKARSIGMRKQYLQNLAYCQYTAEECGSGEAWDHMLKLLEARAIH